MNNPKMSRLIIFTILTIIFLGFFSHFLVDLLSPAIFPTIFSQGEKQDTWVSELNHHNLHVEYIIFPFIFVLMEKHFKNLVGFHVFFSRFITIPIQLRPPIQSK